MKKKKRPFTLLEIIIVIFIITLVTGAIGYSMKGTLDKGRAFRTEQAMDQLKDLLLMCLAEGDKADEIAAKPEFFLKKYGLAKNPAKIVEDGWGQKFTIKPTRSKTDFTVFSDALERYNKKTGRALPNEAADEE
jgi:type II secretory pathway pseudopilin PulG